jgi:anthranilate phosphoribosyltransferase
MGAKKSDAFREILRIVGRGKKLQRDLTTAEAREAMRLMMTGVVSDAQIGGFLVTMRVKEETADEILGFTQGARDAMQAFPKPNVKGLLDIGMPYNGKSRNLQTGPAIGLVLAAAGVPVLMHGADDVPTKNGIALLNLMRALGYPADLPPEELSRSIEQTSFGVLNIGHVLPQWTALTEMRHHFGIRTLMNSVEKLLNPADAHYHISGFYHSAYLNRLAVSLPAPVSWIMQGDEGNIELRPGKKTRVYKADGEEMREYMIDAAEHGFPDEADLALPIDPHAHAEKLLKALRGEAQDAANQIILSAGTILWMIERAPNIESGIAIAREQIASGRALAVLTAAKELV